MDICVSSGELLILFATRESLSNHFSSPRYPCITPKAEYIETKVYSGPLACARFMVGDRQVVTVGGTDASLMVWELVEE